MNRDTAVRFLLDRPAKFANMIGFTKLRDIHNDWIVQMVRGKQDATLQASRGTYKTTCVSVALALIIILLPNYRTMFMRKTEEDTREVIKQVKKILSDPHTQYFVNSIYNTDLTFMTNNAGAVTTNLTTDMRGTEQLVGMGVGGSLTGKHFDFIFTDDIVNVKDRVSKSERENTKLIYQELHNLINRGGRIFNSGTPWHEEDAFSIMPHPQRFDCYHPEIRQIISEQELNDLKQSMIPSLFAANYELRFIPSEDVLFLDPQTGAEPENCLNGFMHLDSAFYGDDYTAWSVMSYHDGKYYLYGRISRKHVEDCYTQIAEDFVRFNCAKLYNETNADKGMVGRDLKRVHGLRVVLYNESMNKYLKIVTYLKAVWKDLVFVEGTDPEYIKQICDYYEDAEHDDAPDSAASLARIFYKKAGKKEYKSLWN